MKQERLFRALTPLVIKSETAETPYEHMSEGSTLYHEGNQKFMEWASHDPHGQQAETIGFFESYGLEFVTDVQGAGVLFFIRFAKRDLPVRVVKARVNEMADEIEEQTGRKPGRKERQNLHDDATAELLPKAFISHTVIPVIITHDDRLFIFSAVAKRLDEITTFLIAFFRDHCNMSVAISYPQTKVSMAAFMTSLAIEDNDTFAATEFAVMRGEESAKIRVQDFSLMSRQVQESIRDGFRIEQIGLMHHRTQVQFRLDEKLQLRQMLLGEDSLLSLSENITDAEQEIMGIAWLAIENYKAVIDDIIDAADGMAEETEDKDGEEW